MKRSKFNLGYQNLYSCDMGELVPCGVMEVLPGDTVQMATSALIRCSALLAPVMHPVRVNIHHWYVPYRLIWDDFEDFITGGPTNSDASVYPTIDAGGSGFAIGSLADYLGATPGVAGLDVSALPFRAYALIWNEFYRDQDLQTELVIDTTSGVDTTTSVTLQNADWEKDYFTSARPWPQKGPAITIPLGTTAPIQGIGVADGAGAQAVAGTERMATGSLMTGHKVNAGAWDNTDLSIKINNAVVSASNPPQIFADLTNASAITVTALREALALQRYAEARAKFGSRYVEYLRYLGVQSSDARLQRPEYLGGGRQVIQFSEVLQTAEGTDPVGELRGHGIAAMRSNRFRKFFEEHGIVISIMTVRPKTMYPQGLFRHWNRRFKEDFWQRELQHIGQQEVLNKEVYAPHASPDGIFGYQDRYDEYRRNESRVSGEFRTTTLDHWHMARIFSTSPALNASFVSSVPTKRIFAVEDPNVDSLYVMARHSIQARRMVARSGQSFIY